MASIKQFRARKVTAKPIPFEVTYDKVTNPDPKEGEDKATQPAAAGFNAVPEVPGKWLLEVGASMAGEESDRVAAINTFLDRVIVPAEKPRWKQVMGDTENVLDMDMLAEITNYLIEAYSEQRPTGQPKP